MEPFHSTHPSTFRTFYDNDDHHVVLDRSGEVLSRTDRSKVQQNVQEDTNTQMRGSREHNESDVRHPTIHQQEEWNVSSWSFPFCFVLSHRDSLFIVLHLSCFVSFCVVLSCCFSLCPILSRFVSFSLDLSPSFAFHSALSHSVPLFLVLSVLSQFFLVCFVPSPFF